jgi:RNA polymerase primary sigma factor
MGMARHKSSQDGGSAATLSSAVRAAFRAPEPMDLYLSAVRAHELLTREQELELAAELEQARRERSEVLAGWPQAVQDLLDRARDTTNLGELVRISKEDEQGLARTSERMRRLVMSYGRACDAAELGQFARAFAQVPWSDRCIRPYYAELCYRARQLEQITTELRQLCTVNAGMPLEYYEDHAPPDLLDFEWLDLAATKGVLSKVALGRIRAALEVLQSRARIVLRNVGLSGGELCELYGRMKAVERSVRALRDRMVVSNLRLVISIARRYVNRGVDMADLVQEGNIGLLRAVDGFDYRLGYKFSTYATWWIRQAVSRSLAERSRTIRLPVHVHEALVKLNRTTDRLVHRLGREPTIEELEQATGLSEERVRQLFELVVEPLSLESPLAEDSDASLGQRVVDENALLPDEEAEQVRLKSALLGALSMLEPREAQVLRMRFGLDMNREHTLEEVGRQLGVTRERVRQLEVRALTKLRHPSRAAWLRTFIEP